MIIFYIFLIIFLGYLIMNLFDHSLSFIEKISTGFYMSSGLFTLLLFILGFFGVSFSLRNSLVVLICLIILTLILNIGLGQLSNLNILKIKNIHLDTSESIIIALLVIIIASSFVSNIYWPVRDWDALTLYDFRAKYFASFGGFSGVFNIHRYYLGYPLYTSILHGIIYLIKSNGNPHFLYSLIYTFFLGGLFSILNRIVGKKVALSCVFIVAFFPDVFQHSKFAYTNLPYSAFILLGYLYLINFVQFRKLRHLVLSSVLLGLSSWVRSSDPFWLPALILMIVELIRMKKNWYILLIMFLIIGLRLPWTLYVEQFSKNFSVTSSNNYSQLLSHPLNAYIYRLFEICSYIWINVIRPQLIIYIAFVFSVFVYIPRTQKVVPVTRLLVFLNLLIIAGGTYFYSFIYSKWQLVGDSVSRMSLFMCPLIIISITLTSLAFLGRLKMKYE